MQDWRELFAACGGDLDNEFVTIPDPPKMIDIVLKVSLVGVDFLNGTAGFRPMIDDRLEGTETGSILHTEYDLEDIELPLHAIHLAPDVTPESA